MPWSTYLVGELIYQVADSHSERFRHFNELPFYAHSWRVPAARNFVDNKIRMIYCTGHTRHLNNENRYTRNWAIK